MKRAVAIVGTHPGTRDDAPWSSASHDIWVFNEAAGQPWVKKWDACFQLHLPIIFRNPNNRNDKNHWPWLQRKHNKPVYMQDVYPDVPASTKFPLNEICEALLPKFLRKDGKQETTARYFTSSVAYAIAFAIYLGYERIELYGVEMATETEYLMQRDGVAFWLGIALGRGIETVLPEKANIMKGLLYGYEGDVVIHRQAFETEANALAKSLATISVKLNNAAHNVQTVEKKIAAAKDDKEAEQFSADYVKARKAHIEAVMEYGVVSGALQTNERYLKQIDEMIRAVGGEKAVEAMLPEYAHAE